MQENLSLGQGRFQLIGGMNRSVVNMPRYGCYSQVRIAIQLGRYQKDLGSV